MGKGLKAERVGGGGEVRRAGWRETWEGGVRQRHGRAGWSAASEGEALGHGAVGSACADGSDIICLKMVDDIRNCIDAFLVPHGCTKCAARVL